MRRFTLAALASVGCASLSQATRDDVSARMASINGSLSECYQAALQRNRNLAGTMTVAFVAEKATGRFIEVTVKSNQAPDADLERCVVDKVGALKLEKPTTSRIGVEYPVTFAAVD